MQQITIAGRIGKDAEPDREKDRVRFSVAVDDRRGGGEKVTVWYECTLYGKRGTALMPHLTKGTVVSVAGKLRTWVKKDGGAVGHGIEADEVSLLGGGQRREAEAPAADPSESW